MMRNRLALAWGLVVLWSTLACGTNAQDRLEPIQYNNPGLAVDLGVGLWAWPLPMDYTGNGHLDLVVSCPDLPHRGTWLFENPGPRAKGQGPREDERGLPIFKPPVRIADHIPNGQVSYVNGHPVVMAPATIYADFIENQLKNPIKLPLPVKIDPQHQKIRANQWKLVDFDGDGDLDIIVGVGVWDDYGWDDAWDENGNWKNGPLHGYVYLVENVQGEESGFRGQDSGRGKLQPLPEDVQWPEFLGPRPVFAPPRKLEAGGKPIDVYGMPSPNFADFTGNGKLDLICGEFLDGFTYFENIGTRKQPVYAEGVRLSRPAHVSDPTPIRMNLQMITPVAIDWNGNGHIDLICGDEDGRVAFIENTGESVPGHLRFRYPVYFQQEAYEVKFGALVTPFSIDWNGNGREDLICGNTAGDLAIIENLGGGDTPRWAAPTLFRRVNRNPKFVPTVPLRHQAGPKGSIQGPCEAKWGYTAPVVADWNHDGRLDLVVNDIWGKVTWYQQGRPAGVPFDHTVLNSDPHNVIVRWASHPLKPEWVWWVPEPGTLTTQWRTTPCVLDWNGDGLNDLLMLDHEGYLAFYERRRAGDVSPPINVEPNSNGGNRGADAPRSPDELVLLPPKRVFKIMGPCEFDSRHRPVGEKKDDLLRLNALRAGASGRRKLHFVDWDGDGRVDLLVNSVNVNWLRNVHTDEEGFIWFQDMGPLCDRVLAGHTTSPCTVDWDGNGIPDLLVGGEDGRLYYKRNPRAAAAQ